jgi:hypothetical protein
MNGNNSLLCNYLLFIFLLSSGTFFGQIVINGKITATLGETLAGTSILLKDKEDNIVGYAISGDKGDYLLEAKQYGEYILEASFLGYEKQFVTLSIAKTEKNIEKHFILNESDALLREVVIEAEQPVKRVGDTLVYDAKALSTGHEVVVEDLLKNIPGITVMDDGTIRYGDKEVEKVMVGGDDLFNKGYSLLTKNMPTKPLDKVEVLRNYSKNKLLKGIENSDGVALNLTVSDEYKAVWFGNLTVGYGNDNRHKASGNLMNFGKSYKNFFSFALNNAGIDNVGNVADMQYNSSDIETIGMGSRASQVMNLSAKVSRIDEKRTRFNNAKMGTFSTILPISDRTKLRVNGFLGYDNLYTYQNMITVRDFENTYFENREFNNSKSNIRKGYVSAYVNSDISDTKMLQSLSTFNSGSNVFRNDLTFNGVSTREQLETRNTYFDQQLTYTHKWNKRNVVLLKGRFLTDRLPQHYGVNDYLMGDLFQYDSINAVGNDTRSNKQYAGLQADFKLKQKNNDLIAFTVGYDNNHDNLNTQFRLFTENEAILPNDFQSRSTFNIGDFYAQTGYSWNLSKFSIGGNLNIHQLFNRFENKEGIVVKQAPFFINPILDMKWEIKPDNILSGYYMYNVSNSSILQVNDGYLLNSSRSFNRGLGYFNQLESSVANLNFTTKHYLNRYSFSVGVTYSRQNDVISYRSQLEQNSSLSEAFVMRGGGRTALNINAHRIIRSLKGSLGFDVNLNRFVYYNEVNGSNLRKNTMFNQMYALSWKSSFKSVFNFNLATEWNFSRIASDYVFKNTSKYSYLDLMLAVTDKFDIKAKTEHYNFGGLDSNNNYFFADFEAKYSFHKDKYSVSLDGKNLFNTDMFTTYNVSDLGYTTNSYRLLPRYVMVSFTYRF